MLKDPGTKKSLARMTGIEERINGEVAHDYGVVYDLQKDLKSSITNGLARTTASLSLAYLMLFHPSALVRHEAAFSMGEYGANTYTFLSYSALNDADAVVRHEATLAIANHPRREFRERRRWVLEYIAANDRSKMVRDTAKVALSLP